MSIFEQSRYYFNYVLPDIIVSNLIQINLFLSQYWWLFLILVLILIMLDINFFRKNLQLKLELRAFDEYYKELSQKKDLKDIELFLLKSMSLIRGRFSALYELRGETYILIESNTINTKALSAPLRIGKKNLDKFRKGHYK